jgi:hypothetical protein
MRYAVQAYVRAREYARKAPLGLAFQAVANFSLLYPRDPGVPALNMLLERRLSKNTINVIGRNAPVGAVKTSQMGKT